MRTENRFWEVPKQIYSFLWFSKLNLIKIRWRYKHKYEIWTIFVKLHNFVRLINLFDVFHKVWTCCLGVGVFLAQIPQHRLMQKFADIQMLSKVINFSGIFRFFLEGRKFCHLFRQWQIEVGCFRFPDGSHLQFWRNQHTSNVIHSLFKFVFRSSLVYLSEQHSHISSTAKLWFLAFE